MPPRTLIYESESINKDGDDSRRSRNRVEEELVV
jgi:hypothetical protein